jgi:TPP-dependent pyruvate/acetoin dehydrogenase alpha subunit
LLEWGVSEGLLNALDEEVEKEVESALDFARRSPLPAPETVGEYVYI